MNKLLLLFSLIIFSISANAQTTNQNQCAASGPLTINPTSCGSISETPLTSSDGVVIGKVQVEKNGNFLTVKYIVTSSNWGLSETYLHVSSTETGIPTNSVNNPDFGAFSYKGKHNLDSIVTYSNIDVTGWSESFIATRAVAHQLGASVVDLDAFEATLPTSNVTMQVDLVGAPSYFEVNIFTGVQQYIGVFYGNCVDLDNPINEGNFYNVKMVSSYSNDAALLGCIVDNPYNLDLVNYIINQDYSGIGATGREVQAAVWTLLDSDSLVAGYGNITWSDSLMNIIIADAQANGENYVPECGGDIVVLLDMGCSSNNNSNATIKTQQTITYLPVSAFPTVCGLGSAGDCSTFWGAGKDFGGTGCSTYFRFCL